MSGRMISSTASTDAAYLRLIVVGVVRESARDRIDAIAGKQVAIEEAALIADAALEEAIPDGKIAEYG
jgi:hypothetical protein